MMMKTKLLLVDDHAVVRSGLRMLLDGQADVEIVGEAGTASEAINAVSTLKPDVVLMDIGLPGMDGIAGVRELRKLVPDALALILTIYEDNEKVFDALCAGAAGYLVKNTKPEQLVDAVVEAVNGGSPMSANIARKVVGYFHKSVGVKNEEEILITKREREILTEMSRGCSYQQVGDVLFISVDTVRHHIRNIYRKMQVHSQSEAVTKALKKGWI